MYGLNLSLTHNVEIVGIEGCPLCTLTDLTSPRLGIDERLEDVDFGSSTPYE